MYTLFFFILGSILGSFLNVVILRSYHNTKGIYGGRSRCFQCNHRLNWFDLIPIFSFILLRGKCRYCKNKISLQYPFIEILTGLIFVINSHQFISQANIPQYIYISVLSTLLLILFVYDIKYYTFPKTVLYSIIVTSYIYNLIYEITINQTILHEIILYSFSITFVVLITAYSNKNKKILGKIIAILVYFFPIILIPFINSSNIYSQIIAISIASIFALQYHISSGKIIGYGDVLLTLFMSIILGWEKTVLAFSLSYILGGIIASIYLLKGKSTKAKIAFGPFLCTATYITFMYGENIIHWYMNFGI